jgi:glycosyltransferase involved in cell wall biosynthesis
MTILLFSAGFFEYMIEMANSLSKEHVVILSLPKGRVSEKHLSLIESNVKYDPFYFVDYKSVRENLKMLNSIRRLIKNNGPEVLHVQNYGTRNFWLILPFIKNVKLINTIHDPQPHSGDILNKTYKWNSKLINRFTDRVVVHGEKLKSEIIKFNHISEKKIDVIPHGELSIYKKWRTNTYDRIPLTFLFFGRIWPYKGLEYFIEASNQLCQIYPKSKFIIAGKGEDLDRYTSQINNQQNFEIINRRISEKEVDELFQKADCMILPYKDATQSGVIPIAFAYEVFVIASDVGAISELVEDKKTGLLFESRNVQELIDKILWFNTHTEEAIQMRTNAKLFAESTLSWESISKKLILAYQK